MSKPASTPFDGAAALLARLDAIVRRALAAAEPLLRQPDSDPFRGLHIDADTIARTLTQTPAAPLFASTGEETLPDGVVPGSPLARIAAAYGLDPFDVDVLIVALGPELDLRYERIYSYLQDDVTRRRPAVNLALDLLCTSAEDKLRRRAHFSAAAPLLRHRVIEWVDDPHRSQPSLLTATYRADPQIVRCVAGDGGLDARLAHCATLITDARPVLVSDPGSASARVVAAVERAGIEGDALTLCFHGPDESERTATAHAVASVAHRVLLHVDLARDPEVEPLLPIVFREAELHAAVLLLDRWDSLSGSPALRTLQAHLRTHAGICILSGERPWIPGPLGPPGVVAEHFGVPPAEVRTARWAEALEFTTGSIDEELARTLGGRFRLSADRIWDAALTARQLAQARNGADLAGGPRAEDFFAAARRQCGHELASIATRVALSATWEDIVLPADSLAQLRELCARIALSHRVLDEWGFDGRLSHGKGVAALFSGPSGTGKTMAAEVVANELGLDLYRVEIPAVMSKWIGETEKNLDKVFRFAENAILFFDEADALFGKRSEVRDAHDRYANVEISYLLQRIETFDGLAILATNVRHHMDEAFLRRLTFVIQFPFPEDAQRQQIWERIWPQQTPLADDLDFAALARTFKLSGGNVKNIALAAAFAAATRGAAVGMTDVIHAVKREYQKLGKNLDDGSLALPAGEPCVVAGAMA